jgi:ribosome-binding factor A
VEGESTRQKKVSRLIQKDIAGILTLKVGEIVPGKIVSVTKVRITPDLSIARVYLSFFPSDNQEEDIKAMQANTGKIRFELGQKVRSQLRIVPELVFYLDDSQDYIDKIDKLLKS